jgi:asparagine synthase (glutamine-hydrolysing)
VSGFAGIISLDGAPPDARLLERMAQTLAFRGPDGTHITAKPGAGFCFTFLRTGPAPQCPSQPCSLDGKVWLLGDVRLDGRDDLRSKLEQYGDEIEKDVTDEELLLRAWRRWREDCLPDLIGDYSFTLWDAEKRRLLCARDLMGGRPFFYARTGNCLYFSNTLNAIRCATDICSAVDDHFIGDFLLQGWCSYPERTAFREISRLRAGHALHYSSLNFAVRRFTSLPMEEPLWLKREEEYVERFRDLLETAVRERLPAGPVAIFMSGGLDSTSVAALAVHSAKKTGLPIDLRAFTVDCQPVFDDQEGRLALLVSEHLGISTEIQQGTSCRPFQGWDHPRLRMPEPFHEPYRSLYLEQVSQIKKHSCVALNGYGGDGIMTGQTWPYLTYLARRCRLRAIAGTFGKYVLKHWNIPPLRGGFRSRIQGALGMTNEATEYPSWMNSALQERTELAKQRAGLCHSHEKSHQWYPDAAYSLNAGLWAAVLENEDAGWTQFPLESRAPLLDLRIHRFLLRLPPIPLCINKELLRRAMLGYLPDEVRLRPKAPSAGDLLDFQVRNGTWSPSSLPAPNEAVLAFIDWPRLTASIATPHAGTLWRDLRPYSLLYWLQGAERQPTRPNDCDWEMI